MEALSAAMYGSRLGEPGVVAAIAAAVLATTANDSAERAQDLLLRGQALLCARGQEAAPPRTSGTPTHCAVSPNDRSRWLGRQACSRCFPWL